ncbi:hypothetical protein A8924_1486 [Saccharopolyspora erythraea NRRL 2338]|uniref:Uncharacterized protein n=1 Tax=Saccharopolyspora erythraea TaxID=1836 RepID=A0ABN1D2T0_SACER|nr:hypothetical protein [Saccharopolyspora erythraea]EQD86005.1 hypothetical protein N599_11895 [Saccharopolyspora erythraea D]PFG94219.1 hypothetical protein A8924_1486 [Saccharopolyspora erythraea NRRL 2338]QRK90995.1 hypothetical protein JQX30_05975 [Saccharopolyspora erythraea]
MTNTTMFGIPGHLMSGDTARWGVREGNRGYVGPFAEPRVFTAFTQIQTVHRRSVSKHLLDRMI